MEATNNEDLAQVPNLLKKNKGQRTTKIMQFIKNRDVVTHGLVMYNILSRTNTNSL